MYRTWRLLTVCACATSACATVVETTTVQLHQSALVPAPSGPRAIGPQLTRGQVSLEGGASGHLIASPQGSIGSGGLGNVPGRLALRGRVAVGLTDAIELGFDFEYVNAAFGEAVARDVDETPAASLYAGGAQLRGLLGQDTVRFGLAGELSVASVPFLRQVVTTITQETFVNGERVSSGTRVVEAEDRDPALFVYVRFIPSVVVVAPPFHARVGGMVHNQPVVDGQETATVTCTRRPGQLLHNCVGEALDDVDKLGTAVMATVFASAAVELGEHVVVIGQVFAHAAGPQKLADTSRFGGAAALRLVF